MSNVMQHTKLPSGIFRFFSYFKGDVVRHKLAFLLLFCLLIAKHIPCWVRFVLPHADVLYAYQGFHVFYNELVTNGILCQWLPFQGYGVQSSLAFHIFLSPPCYFVGVLGWLFGMTDTLFLFNTAVFLQELILLTGLFLLCKKNFSHLRTVFFVCSVVILSTISVHQLWVNHFLFYSFPLIIYCLQNFLSKNQLHWLLLSANIFLLSLLGTCGYSAPLQFLPISIFIVALLVTNRKQWQQHLQYEKRDLLISALLFIGICVFIFAYLILILDAKALTVGLDSSRDPVTFQVPFQDFMREQDAVNKRVLLDLFFPLLYKTDFAIYMGSATLFFCILSLFSKKTSFYYALVATLCGIVLFVMSSISSNAYCTFMRAFFYQFYPGMKYVRHISYTLVDMVVLAPLISGFGLEFFIKKTKEFGNFLVCRLPVVVIFLPTGIIFLSLFQLGFYQQQVVRYHAGIKAEVEGEIPHSVFFAEPLKYQPIRTDVPITKRAVDGQFVFRWPKSETYAISYSFLGWDPAVYSIRFDYLHQHVAELIRQKGGTLLQKNAKIPPLESLRNALGYHSQKIKVIKAEALEEFDSSSEIPADISVRKFTSNSIDLTVSFNQQMPALLYYSDAWSPHWKATIDGRPTEVFRASHAFKAVRISPGIHEVRFFYDHEKVRIAKYVLFFFGFSTMSIFLGLLSWWGVRGMRRNINSYEWVPQ